MRFNYKLAETKYPKKDDRQPDLYTKIILDGIAKTLMRNNGCTTRHLFKTFIDYLVLLQILENQVHVL